MVTLVVMTRALLSLQVREPNISTWKDYLMQICATVQLHLLGFSDIKHWFYESTKYGSVRNAAWPIAQTVCQALLSITGCAFPYNHETAIQFNADRAEDGRVLVKTAGVRTCDSDAGNVSALVSFAKYCMDDIIANNEVEMLAHVRELSSMVPDGTVRNMLRQQKSRTGRCADVKCTTVFHPPPGGGRDSGGSGPSDGGERSGRGSELQGLVLPK